MWYLLLDVTFWLAVTLSPVTSSTRNHFRGSLSNVLLGRQKYIPQEWPQLPPTLKQIGSGVWCDFVRRRSGCYILKPPGLRIGLCTRHPSPRRFYEVARSLADHNRRCIRITPITFETCKTGCLISTFSGYFQNCITK